MSNNSNPTKKRKTNDGRAATDSAHDMSTGSNNGGGFLSSWFGYFSGRRDDAASRTGPATNENNTKQLNRMEQMMTRMEEKLATVSNLERRCEELERKCISLETTLKLTSQATKDHINKAFSYSKMLIQNQSWEYPVPIYTTNQLLRRYSHHFSEAEAEYVYESSCILKLNTEALRRGDFPDIPNNENGEKGIVLNSSINAHLLPYNEEVGNQLSPHWMEFAAALSQFNPAFHLLPDDCDTSIAFPTVYLNNEITNSITEALVNKPFKRFSFGFKHCIFHGGMSTIAAMMDNNKCLKQLAFFSIDDIERNDIDVLAAAIRRHPALVEVYFSECFSNGLGGEMLASLLTNNDLKLERLDMSGNHLLGSQPSGLNVSEQLSNYLASNPRLRHLDLEQNNLNDNDALLIANALRSNTTLRYLYLKGNHISKDGFDVLRRALYDESSLNSAADSNHTCSSMDTDHLGVNNRDVPEDNRAWKIYTILSKRNKTMSNVQHFGDIDIKLLPNVLEAVEKYSLLNGGNVYRANALSIVYEIMHRWDKVSPLYKTLGKPLGLK